MKLLSPVLLMMGSIVGVCGCGWSNAPKRAESPKGLETEEPATGNRGLNELDAALQLKPDDMEALFDRARILETLPERQEHALRDYTAMLAVDPRNVKALICRAFVLRGLKKHADACRDISAAFALGDSAVQEYLLASKRWIDRVLEDALPYSKVDNNPKQPRANLAEALRVRGNEMTLADDEALGVLDLTAAIALEPDDLSAYKHRASGWMSLSNPRAAAADYTVVLKRHSDDIEILKERAYAYYEANLLEDALRDLEAIVKAKPNDGSSYSVLGDIFAEKGDFERSDAVYCQAITLLHRAENKDGIYFLKTAYEGRGDTRLALKRYAESVEDFTAAIGYIRNEEALGESTIVVFRKQLLCKRARAWHYLGEREKCDADFAAAIALDNDRPTFAFTRRAEFFTEVGEFDKAHQDLEFVLRKAPEASGAIFARAKLHFRQGNKELAEKDRLRAVALNAEFADVPLE